MISMRLLIRERTNIHRVDPGQVGRGRGRGVQHTPRHNPLGRFISCTLVLVGDLNRR